MRKHLTVVLVVLMAGGLFPRPIEAQVDRAQVTVVSSGACNAGACADFVVAGPSVTLQVSGTFIGTLTFEATSDGVNYFTASLTNLADMTQATTATAGGQWGFNNPGIIRLRARATAWTSGTANVAQTRGAASVRNGTVTPGSTGLFGVGTLTNPSISFLSDPSTGFYSGGAGQLNITIGGVVSGFWGSSSVTFPSILYLGIGQDTPIARDAAGIVALKNSSTAQKFRIYQTTTGPVANTLDATAPTIQGGTFGTSPTVVAGSTAFSWRINVGTGGVATSGVIVVPAATNGWNCPGVTDMTTNIVTRQTASTTTTITLTAASAWTASDILVGTCISY